MGTAGSIDNVKFYHKDNSDRSLLNRLLEKFPMWNIEFPDLENSDSAKALANSQRSFDISRKSVYDFMIDDIITSLFCTGGDNMEFRAVNCGYADIENVAFFKEFLLKEGFDLDEYMKHMEQFSQEYLKNIWNT